MQEELDNTAITHTQQTSAIVIANPSAGSYQREKPQIEETIAVLRQHGWKADLKLTQGPGDARRLAREAVAQGLDVVVAVGGDGTINEVIQELAGSNTALGVLPSGTINVWARETGIPLEHNRAREILLNGQTRRVDLGKFHDRYFLLMASIGFDGEVTRAVEKKPIKRFGVLAYLILGAWLGIGYPNFQVMLQMGEDEKRFQAVQVIIGNTQLYAGAIRFTWQAKCDDGLLNVCLVRSATLAGRLQVIIDFLLRHKRRDRWVRYETSDLIKLHTNRPVAIQVDGEPAGYISKSGEPTIFSVEHNTLKVIVPQEVPEALFSEDDTQTTAPSETH